MGILAMTESMQDFTDWMLEDKDSDQRLEKRLPPLILVFNEKEAIGFGEQLSPGLSPLMKSGSDLPNIYKFAHLIREIRNFFNPIPPLRIYVTIGAQGSLGYDAETNEVIYVSCFNRPRDHLYDTNACGDAYCAAVTLLEWGKRNGFGGGWGGHREMEYFMAVASAAAYCKATDRRGRVDSRTVAGLAWTHPFGEWQGESFQTYR